MSETIEEKKARKAEYQRRWYEKNKAAHVANVQARRDEVKARTKAFVRKYKEENPCVDCGNYFPFFVLDFDHLGDKEALISRLVGNGHDIARVQEEMDKCELVCANCHRYRTFKRNGMYEMGL